MPTVDLLTWNLDKRDAALTALAEYVASASRNRRMFVVAVQESVPDATELHALVRAAGGTVHAVGNGTMSVLSSDPLDETKVPPSKIPRDPVGERLVLTRVTLAGQRVALVNYHGCAHGQRGSPEPEERGGIASEARWRIDDHVGADLALVLGDFNAEPEDSEILSRHCLWLPPDPLPGHGKSHDRDRRRLCIAVAQFPPGIAGTLRFQHPSAGMLWRRYDFIAASADAAVSAEVLSTLAGKPLMEAGEPLLSDHLPVAGRLELP